MSMVEAVERSLAADAHEDADEALVELVRTYARAIDRREGASECLVDLGSKMLAALESLQLSPRARALARVHSLGEKGVAGVTGAARHNRLDELREQRQRKHAT